MPDRLASLAPLPTRMDYISSTTPDNYAIRKALQKLGDVGYQNSDVPMRPRVTSWEDFPFSKGDDRGVDYRPVGWIRNDEKENRNIYIGDWGEHYKKASKGNDDSIKSIAGTLAHEYQHINEGNEEGQAYQKQLDVLRSLRAPSSNIMQIEAVQRHLAPNYKRPKR